MRRLRTILLSLSAAGLAGSVLVACTGVATTAGLIGGGTSLVVGLIVFLLTATTQTGCSSEETIGLDACLTADVGGRFDACLSIGWDGGGRPDARDARFEPCLGQPLEDAGPDAGDARFDVCLSVPWDGGPDAGDARFEPCLSQPFDACLSDRGPPDAGEPDAKGADAEPRDLARLDRSKLRDEVIRRLAAKGSLPKDVAQKLGASNDGEEV
jgi:hypothetical protein